MNGNIPEAAGPGRYTESGEVIFGAEDPVPARRPVSAAEAERRYARAFPEYRGTSSPAAARARGITPDEVA
jgi:hypothetical protein